MPPEKSAVIQRSFILRLWIEAQPTGPPLWRCILLDPYTGIRIGFDAPSELAGYLTTGIAAPAQQDKSES